MQAILLFILSLTAFAQTPVVFNQIITGGTGCPGGTVTSILSPDGTSLSLIFDEFRVEVPNHEIPTSSPAPGRGSNYRPPRQNTSPYESSKTCNIAFSATIPVGMKATGIDISLQARGNTMMDVGLQGYFSTILVGHRGLANSTGPTAKVVKKKIWTTSRAPVGEDWLTDTKTTVNLASSCATASNRSIKFELKNHLEAKILKNDLSKSGIITVDSNDARGMLTFTVATASCR